MVRGALSDNRNMLYHSPMFGWMQRHRGAVRRVWKVNCFVPSRMLREELIFVENEKHELES